MIQIFKRLKFRYSPQSLPYRWKIWFTIFMEILNYEIIVRTGYLFTNNGQVNHKTSFICSILLVHKPECSKFESQMLDYFCANRGFNCLYSYKEQSSKFFSKKIKVNNVVQTTHISELMRSTINFKISPITCKTK